VIIRRVIIPEVSGRYLQEVVDSDIPTLPKADRARIRRAIESRLTADPIEYGKPLRFSSQRARRLRVGDYRVICRVEPPRAVLVIKIGRREEVYGKHR
jgi:mRNA interferase RelE/StbE